ncbi:MAG: hypothetical protein GX162_02070 [Firmicutes bacterium]|nr:hypothetical protein [Bacillota bacterium]
MDAVYDWVAQSSGNSPLLFMLLFALSFINAFLPMVPIETISVFAGYLSEVVNGNAYIIVLAVTLGSAIGSTILFLLARSQGHRLLELGFVKRQVTPARLDKTQGWFRHYGLWMIFAGKLVPGMSLVTVVSSGLFRLGMREALVAIYLANFLYFSVAVALGRFLGEEWRAVNLWGRRLWPYVLAVVVVALVAVGLRNRLRKRIH